MDHEASELPEATDDNGSVQIADEVVGVIAGIAAAEVEGVIGLSGGIAGGIAELLGKRSFSKGIKVEIEEKETNINMFLVVGYGVRIPDIAQEVQEKVKKSVDSMTGLKVTEVNVHIQGVSFQDEVKEDEVDQ